MKEDHGGTFVLEKIVSGCMFDTECNMKDQPTRASLVSSGSCETQVVEPHWKSTYDGPVRFFVDYDEAVVVVEDEVEQEDGRTVTVKETWRQLW